MMFLFLGFLECFAQMYVINSTMDVIISTFIVIVVKQMGQNHVFGKKHPKCYL